MSHKEVYDFNFSYIYYSNCKESLKLISFPRGMSHFCYKLGHSGHVTGNNRWRNEEVGTTALKA